MFTTDFIEARRVSLIAQRDACREQLNRLNDPIEDGGDAVDRTEVEISRKARIDTQGRNMKELAEIDAALTRISRGTYGICELTGEPILEARLEAIPTARYNVKGQKKHEKVEMKKALIKRDETPWIADDAD